MSFERNSEGINGILINYHLTCATLVLIAAVNFLIDPKVVPGTVQNFQKGITSSLCIRKNW